MSDTKQDVLITGLGLLSSLGEGPEAHWSAFRAGKTQNIDEDTFAPYPVHALMEPDWAQQISRRDMRQMEPWQQIGTYAAGLALDDAGVKGNEELCGLMDMIVAAGGGERDVEVDSSIMAEGRNTNDRDTLLAERLSNDLRPTLFLAQLSNLLAGNISIVHKVTGSSRTFMGEEGAGISAIETAHARIASGQSDIVLVGGAYNAQREDMQLLFALGGFLHEGAHAAVSERKGSGMILGSVGTFLVLESRAHAEARGARAYAKLAAVSAMHGPRGEGMAEKRISQGLDEISKSDVSVIMSGSTGCKNIHEEEQAALAAKMPQTAVRAYGTLLGHSVECQFPTGVALAALSAFKNEVFSPLEASEQPSQNGCTAAVVTTAGHWRGEGVALVTAADA